MRMISSTCVTQNMLVLTSLEIRLRDCWTASSIWVESNASAVAVLLEVSRLLREHQCKRTIRYVAFACEEPPYFNVDAMGSQYHARQARMRGDKIRGMLCLEMVGYYSTDDNSQAVPPLIPKWMRRFFPHQGDFLAAVGNMPSWKLCWNFRRGFKRGA